jgi:hypothetical protein
MSYRAPLRVPVELRHDGRSRWFRLTTSIAEEHLLLAQICPEELDGPVGIAFHLPGDPVPIRCRARAAEEIVGEGEEQRAERRILRFVDLEPEGRERIANYITERLGLFA